MSEIRIRPIRHLRGEITLPGDKSISHRAIILASLARGKTLVSGISRGEDVLNTARVFQSMGIEIKGVGSDSLTIPGKGLRGLSQPKDIIDCGNSGTTMRLLSGILAAQDFSSTITGDESLRKRPMDRVVEPLEKMGAKIEGRFAPLKIEGKRLKAISYRTSISSAQVKSAILLAGLYASGKTEVTEPARSRDHTERMLKYLEADIEVRDLTSNIMGGKELAAKPINIPGDISSASFFMVGAILLPGSHIKLSGVGLNPTRTGVIDILKRMGAKIEIENLREENNEPLGDIIVKGSNLRGITISGEIIPRVIDELPILALAATKAEGKTVIKDARELRVKETDRIRALVTNLSIMGARVEEKEDGLVIQGPTELRGGRLDSFADHRMAIALIIGGLIAQGETVVSGTDCIKTSFPEFEETLDRLKVVE
ncbi:MAG TPA: 3-phosphoshikimate 1-carboxyvinyltransferase [bacterium]|nr:3-phosphoshikimate 1-carboxyvinyltransferase [bacterium]